MLTVKTFIDPIDGLIGEVLDHYNAGAARVCSIYGSGIDPKPKAPQWSRNDALQAIYAHSGSYRARQRQAYVFDTLALDIPPANSVEVRRESRNKLARELDGDNFFDASCAIRAIDPAKIEQLARDLLDETEESYLRSMRFLFDGPVEESFFAQAYADVLKSHSDRYSVDRIMRDIEDGVSALGVDDMIEIARHDRGNISTNITVITPRKATVFLAQYGGLESYRAAFHALGHALYAVQAEVLEEDLIGVNIAATEVSAFLAQELALISASPEQRKFLEVMPTYYARLYALRVIDESLFYREGPRAIAERSCYAARLGVNPAKEFSPGNRLVAVDFVIGFYEYLQRERISSLVEVAESTTTNWRLLKRLGCVTPGVRDAER
ncbi:hypothetical protein [Nocardia sp. X0981]